MLNKFFLADRNNKSIDVVDPTTFQITQFVNPGYAGFTGNNDTSGPDGVLTVQQPTVTELWVGDSPGKVWVLDATPAPSNIPGARGASTIQPDLGRRDHQSRRTLLRSERSSDHDRESGRGPALRQLHLDHDLYRSSARLDFDGRTEGAPKATNGLEQCGWSPKTGKFYQNVPEVDGPGNDTAPGAIAVINPADQDGRASFPVPHRRLRRPARNGHRPE